MHRTSADEPFRCRNIVMARSSTYLVRRGSTSKYVTAKTVPHAELRQSKQGIV